MNPKKQIMKYLNNPSCDHAPDETCAVCEKVQRIQDGMSAGTATLFIAANAVGNKYTEQYPIEGLVNQGRYYTCRVVDIEKPLVEKQTGEVRFV